MLKKIGVGVVIIFITIQFFRPERNLSNDQTYDIMTKYEVSPELEQIFKVSCNDCHSNNTIYPWYSNIQPLAWWMDGHIKQGKRKLNFSEFTNRPIAIQNHKIEEIIEMIEELEMPLASYTYLGLHQEAELTDEQRKLIIDWSRSQMAMLKANYPPDSLKMKRRSKPSK